MSSNLSAQFVETPRENVIISSEIHGYWEYLPSDYNSNPTKKYPLLVAWHGVGEVGNGALPSMQLLLIHGVPRVIEWNIFPQSVTFNGQSYSFIVLNPQYMDQGVSVMDVDAFLNYAFANYRVDQSRVYLTGYSYGAILCYQYAGNNDTYAKKVTSIVPLAPCIDANYNAARIIAANNIAVWGIHGNADIECPSIYTPDWANTINTANNNIPPMPPAVYTLTPSLNPGDPHDIFWATYEQGFAPAPTFKNIYDWSIQYARNVALPIKLKNFTAQYKEGHTEVDWITSDERDTKTFNVERASKDLRFQTIASIPASGFSNSEKSYTWIDEHPANGINYYRLALVNIDQSKEFFEIKKVNVDQGTNVELISSNPVQGSLRVNINLLLKEKLLITLNDMQGRSVYKRSAIYAQGQQNISIETTSLPAGTYILQVKGDDFTRALKVVKN